MQENLKQVAGFIAEQKRVAIVSHHNPDGDTLGSQLALALALEQLGIETVLINHETISAKYNFVHGHERIVSAVALQEVPRVVIFVDCASLALAGYEPEDELLQGKIIVNIDHHMSNAGYGQYNYVCSQSAANCQNVYDVILALGASITPEIATALYLGLSTDTGNFLYDNVTAETFRIAADLIEHGADAASLRLNIYESCSLSRMQLQTYIYNHISFSADGRCAWSQLDWKLLEEVKADSTDIDGLINLIKNIDGVEIALLFRENSAHKIKVSLRSKNWSDVNLIANQFGGGGHVRAAGCTIDAGMAEAQQQMIAAVEEYFAKAGQQS